MPNVFKTLVNMSITQAGATRTNYNIYTAPAGTRAIIKQFSALVTILTMVPVTSYAGFIVVINGKDLSMARIPGIASGTIVYHNINFVHRTSISGQFTSIQTLYGLSDNTPASIDNAVIEATQLLQFGIVGITGLLTTTTVSLQVSGIEIS